MGKLKHLCDVRKSVAGKAKPDHNFATRLRRLGRTISVADLLLYRPPKAQHISVVVDDLEGPESVAGIGQIAMHENLLAGELFVQCVGIVGVDVGVPAGPFVARVVRLGMYLGRDRLEVQHDLIASHEGPEIRPLSVAAALVANVEPQFGLVKRNRGVQVVNNKEGSNTVQHSVTAVDIEYIPALIAYAECLVQSGHL